MSHGKIAHELWHVDCKLRIFQMMDASMGQSQLAAADWGENVCALTTLKRSCSVEEGRFTRMLQAAVSYTTWLVPVAVPDRVALAAQHSESVNILSRNMLLASLSITLCSGRTKTSPDLESSILSSMFMVIRMQMRTTCKIRQQLYEICPSGWPPSTTIHNQAATMTMGCMLCCTTLC